MIGNFFSARTFAHGTSFPKSNVKCRVLPNFDSQISSAFSKLVCGVLNITRGEKENFLGKFLRKYRNDERNDYAKTLYWIAFCLCFELRYLTQSRLLYFDQDFSRFVLHTSTNLACLK